MDYDTKGTCRQRIKDEGGGWEGHGRGMGEEKEEKGMVKRAGNEKKRRVKRGERNGKGEKMYCKGSGKGGKKEG